MRTAGIIRNKMDLVWQAWGGSKPGEVWGPWRGGQGAAPQGRAAAPGVCRHERESTARLCPASQQTDGEGTVRAGQRGRECENVLMGREKQDRSLSPQSICLCLQGVSHVCPRVSDTCHIPWAVMGGNWVALIAISNNHTHNFNLHATIEPT